MSEMLKRSAYGTMLSKMNIVKTRFDQMYHGFKIHSTDIHERAHEIINDLETLRAAETAIKAGDNSKDNKDSLFYTKAMSLLEHIK